MGSLRLCLSRLLVVGSLLVFFEFTAVAAEYVCPEVNGAPVEVNVNVNTRPNRKITVQKSKKGTTCLLFRVLRKDGGSVATFDQNSDAGDYILEPVLRSYDKKAWQAVAGPYSGKVRIFRTDKTKSIVRFKVNRSGQYKYVLIAFANSYKNDNEARARFLLQSTFGPKMSEISGWPHGKGINGFAYWVRNQTDVATTPMTSHREFFRKNLDWSMNHEFANSGSITPQHPCDKYSRWRDYAITGGGDFGKYMVVSEINDGGQTKFLLTIDNEPRTVVDTFASTDNHYSGAGTYQILYGLGEGIGQYIYFRKTLSDPGKVLINPKIYLPDSVLNGNSNVVKFDLPSIDNFEKIDGVLADQRYGWYVGTSHRMKVSKTGSQCTGLSSSGKNDYRNIIGKVSGSDDQFHFAGYAHVADNSIENPVADGGASILPHASLPGGGRVIYCTNAAMDFQNKDSCRIAQGEACVTQAFAKNAYDSAKIQEGVVVCGSRGEVGNSPNLPASKTNMFRLFESASSVYFNGFGRQKENVWSMIALDAPDQLRQRVAWALSQIFVVTPNQIDNAELLSEVFMNYYDIFVRNAFGNYRDILKEVSYSPMMAEMLSFLESRSAAYVKRVEERVSRPDENYAREIMQLFTIGIFRLNADGTLMKVNKTEVPTYDNTDIQTFARAWTGFRRQYFRANFEGYSHTGNRMDPMPIDGARRDQFPKMDLLKNFIGDSYPLCVEEPDKQYLRKGATYRLIGSHKATTLHYELHWHRDVAGLTRINLDSSSELYKVLCNKQGSKCDFKPEVVLTSNLPCGDANGVECIVDNARVVRVQENPDIFYEYLKPPCVELAFSDPASLSKILDHNKYAMCLNKETNDAAMTACCPLAHTESGFGKCEFSMERVKYQTSEDRCALENMRMCDAKKILIAKDMCKFFSGHKQNYRTFHWTKNTCSIKAKINSIGEVALVHNPTIANDGSDHVVWPAVDQSNINYFKVKWGKGGYPSADSCGALSGCEALSTGECLCDVDVSTKRIFRRKPGNLKHLNRLKIGAHDPSSFDDGDYTYIDADSSENMGVYHPTGTAPYTNATVFRVKRNGKVVFLKNIKYQVTVSGSPTFTFRNPPTFMSMVEPESRDAHYETDAVLDHYFYHPNTPTFVATRLLQRFGFSNPSPRFVTVVSKAFRTGKYVRGKQKVTFGDNQYGNLEATIAAILLDREARRASLDADPASGALREPLLKFIGFMRSMEFQNAERAPELRLGHEKNIQASIGQQVHQTPNVFSFFLPEYKAPGQIAAASLVAPEAQVLNAPNIIGLLNAMFSLIDTGLSQCFEGFGGRANTNCNSLATNPLGKGAHGVLTYQPTATTAAGIVDELALLLTGGRLASRGVIESAYTAEASASNAAAALRYIQKLFITTPEFHMLNVKTEFGADRPDPPTPVASSKPYKAVVFLNLHGGMDGFQMLVPTSGCTKDGKSFDLFANYQKARGEIALLKSPLHKITVANQVCTQFGLHSKLPTIKKFYDDKELTFIANMGVLQQTGVTKNNYRKLHDATALFAHNTQTEETANVDIYDEYAGIGILGRMVDELTDNGFNTGTLSVSGSAPPVVSKKTPLLVVNPFGYAKFHEYTQAKDPTADAKKLNAKTKAGSTFYGEEFSDVFIRALSENALLYEKYKNAQPGATFENNNLERQLAAVAKLIATKDDRGKDRDVFFLERPGYDMHFDIEVPLNEQFKELDNGLSAFKEAMVTQNHWNDVTVVLVSEFARTLMGNTGNGSDHAWGGNYFILSGALDGGKMLGTFPDDLSNDGPLVFAPGIVIPTTPWEGLWHGIAQWFGVPDGSMKKVLPNYEQFNNLMLKQTDLFK